MEVTAEFDLVGRPTPREPWERIALMLCHPAANDQAFTAMTLRFLGGRRRLAVRDGFVPTESWVSKPVGFKDKNTVRIVLWDGQVSVFLNGTKEVDKFVLPPESLEGRGLAIAEYGMGEDDPLRVRIRGLRARRIVEPPPDF